MTSTKTKIKKKKLYNGKLSIDERERETQIEQK